VDETYSKRYEEMGIPAQRARFYGMITNIDENVGRLNQKLADLGLTENTILIFTTDNGTAGGTQGGGYNAGMRGQKGSEYDGGHRVPFFIRWPGGNIGGGRDEAVLTAHIDVLPTLAELCQVAVPKAAKLDGQSLVPLFQEADIVWPERTIAVHSQRVEKPEKWRKAAVMTERWRFVCDGDRRELFDIQTDPGQKMNIAKDHPEVFQRLSGEYESWYESISARFDDYVRITLGDEAENPVHLTCHDWHTNDAPLPWNQQAVSKNPNHNGFWAVDVKQAGRYEITLRMRPHYVENAAPLNTHDIRVRVDYERIKPPQDPNRLLAKALAALSQLSRCNPSDESAKVVIKLEKGKARLRTELVQNDERGAYFVDVQWLGK
jgi:hypothetical protein